MHLAVSIFRAVENRVPLARAVNTGISAFIDGNGRVLAEQPKLQEGIPRANRPARRPGQPLFFPGATGWGLFLPGGHPRPARPGPRSSPGSGPAPPMNFGERRRRNCFLSHPS